MHITEQINRDRYAGIHRGFVADVSDPEQRGRVRVRVPAFHRNIPTSALPWAERVSLDASVNGGVFTPLRAGSGDLTYDGDKVWVMFEGSDGANPVVLGGWRATSDAFVETQADQANARRSVVRTRHGTRVEMSDDPADFEFKIVTPSGMAIHVRESNGGRGIHLTTSGGHTLSMQDEQPGSSIDARATDYDATPDMTYASDAAPQPRSLAAQGDADGALRSGTSITGRGFGQKGVLIETSGGHKLEMRDTTNAGVRLSTANGLVIEATDANSRVAISTPGGNSGVFQDGTGVTLTSQYGQTLNMNATDFGMTWPSLDMYIRFGGAENRWHIVGDLTIDATGSVQLLSGGSMLIQAAGVLTERGSSRVEDPAVGT